MSSARRAATAKEIAPQASYYHCHHRFPGDRSAEWRLITKLATSSVVGIKTASASPIIPFSNVIKFRVPDLAWGVLPTDAAFPEGQLESGVFHQVPSIELQVS